MTRIANFLSVVWRGAPRTLVTGALIVGTVALFWRVVNCEFINLDDPQYVLENPQVQAGLTRESVSWALTTTQAANWHPLTWLSLEIDATLFGLNPAGYHAVNLALHVANTVLLFWALTFMTGEVVPSACVAALFAIHPLHVESVAWVSERKDVLSTLFWILTLIAYTWYAQRPSVGRFAVVIVLFALGLCAKSMVVTLPCVLLLLDYWPLRRWNHSVDKTTAARIQPASAARLLLEKAPLFVLSAGGSLIAVFSQTHGGAVAPMAMLPWNYRLMNAADAYLAYLWKTIWPLNLSIVCPHPMNRQSSSVAAVAAAILAAMTFWVCRRWRRQPYLAVGWFWFLGTLVPVIGVVQVGNQAIADRYTYIPLIGIFMACAWGLAELVRKQRLSGSLVGALGIVACASFGACTWVQLGYWRDDVALWRHAIEITGRHAQACEGLGLALLRRGLAREAIPFLSDVTVGYPDNDAGHFNLGRALMAIGEVSSAKAELQKTLRLNPRHVGALEHLALLLGTEGRWDDAERVLRDALKVQPPSWKLHLMLAETLKHQGRSDEADREIQQALAISPHAFEELRGAFPLPGT